jgi:hypothetical protein
MHKIISPSGGGLFCLLALPILRAAIKRRLEKAAGSARDCFRFVEFYRQIAISTIQPMALRCLTKKENTMKLNSASLFTGVCLVLSAFTAVPAFAVSATGFSLFHVEGPLSSTENPYTCLNESNGAVVNNCSYDVSLEFNLPINTLGVKSLSVQNLWGTTPSFSCTVYAYSGLTGSSYAHTQLA